MTHRFEEPILGEFARMRAGLRPGDQAFVLSDGSAAAPASLDGFVQTFDTAHACSRAVRVLETGILRNVHLAWLDFFDAHPDFDAYWFIEYDVRYSGPWAQLFDAFRDQPWDLLCTHLRRRSQEPHWYWWNEIHAPDGPVSPEQCLRGFLPVTRMSRRGMVCLRDAVAQGWNGFLEGLIPTLLHLRGLRIADVGGTGPFVPAGFRNRFYTSVDDPAGSLMDGGTVRYRPVMEEPRRLPGWASWVLRGRLYPPVKPPDPPGAAA